MAELIQPENNRTFKTGSGDWAGGFVWHPETILGKQGYISCTITEPNPEITITLAYPAIQAVPNKEHRFRMSACLPTFTLTPPHYDWHITDGAGFSYGEVGSYPTTPDWYSIDYKFSIPVGFNLTGALLTIKVYTHSECWGEMAFDDFSFKPVGGPQYLPIMGVG